MPKCKESRVLVSLLAVTLLAPHVSMFLFSPRSSDKLVKVHSSTAGEVVYDTTSSIIEAEGEGLENVEKLNDIVIALYKYENEHFSFPVSAEGGARWSKQGVDGKEWIEGLVPYYLDRLPDYDRRNSGSRGRFIYHSRGVDFKLIAFNAGDCQEVKDKASMLVDPRRPDCLAYGYWTKGAVTQ